MGNKLYVGNLSWSTTEESLNAAFSQAGTVTSAQIPLNHMGKSRGFGFVEMATPEEAQAAIDLFNEKDLDGRVIRVNEAGQAPASPAVNERKLFVGNLSWTTTEDSLREAFGQAGTVVSVKIPLNDMGKSRGIAFVEMSTEDEAQSAIAMFHEKDLDGRAITVNVARPQSPRPRRDEDGGDRGGYRGGNSRGGDRDSYNSYR
jgi:nucleolin